MTTGQRIRQLRKEQGLTAAEMAAALGKRYGVEVLVSSISMYENDQRLPPTETCDALADFFRVSLDYLRGRSDVRNPDEQLAALSYPVDVQDVAQRLSKLSNGMRRDFITRFDPALVKLTEAHDTLESAWSSLAQETDSVAELRNRIKSRISD